MILYLSANTVRTTQNYLGILDECLIDGHYLIGGCLGAGLHCILPVNIRDYAVDCFCGIYRQINDPPGSVAVEYQIRQANCMVNSMIR